MSPLDLEKMKYLYDNVYNPRRITQEALTSPGVDVNWKNIEDADRTLLIQAINSAGTTEGFEKMGIVRLLLDNGADINAKDNLGRTAYDYAIIKKYKPIQVLLLDRGALVGGRKSRKSRKSKKSRKSRRNRRTKRR